MEIGVMGLIHFIILGQFEQTNIGWSAGISIMVFALFIFSTIEWIDSPEWTSQQTVSIDLKNQTY